LKCGSILELVTVLSWEVTNSNVGDAISFSEVAKFDSK